jgi:hypothetical protein
VKTYPPAQDTMDATEVEFDLADTSIVGYDENGVQERL